MASSYLVMVWAWLLSPVVDYTRVSLGLNIKVVFGYVMTLGVALLRGSTPAVKGTRVYVYGTQLGNAEPLELG